MAAWTTDFRVLLTFAPSRILLAVAFFALWGLRFEVSVVVRVVDGCFTRPVRVESASDRRPLASGLDTFARLPCSLATVVSICDRRRFRPLGDIQGT